MFARTFSPAISLSLSLTALMAQTRVPLPEIPADQKAYTQANGLDDPEQKITALMKFRSDFPESAMLRSADTAILTTLVKKFPGQRERIRRAAAEAYRRVPDKERGAAANQI